MVRLGANFTVANPVGEFGQLVDVGYGASGNIVFQPDPAFPIGLHLGGGWLQYGREHVRNCYDVPPGCRVDMDVTTTNNIAYMDFGPELSIPLPLVRPYAGISAGFSYFWTRSSVRDYYGGSFGSTNFDDWAFAWRGRGGMQVRMGRSPVWLDMAAVYHGNGKAEYLTEGDVVDNPDGSVTIYPFYGDANLWTFEFGLSLGLGGPHGGYVW